MDAQLAGKTALVTAGSRGMGRAIAVALAREGMRVAVAARTVGDLNDVVDEIRAIPGEALAICADVSEAADIDRLVAQTLDTFGGIDVLIVNAGGPPAMPFDSADDGAWEAAFNLTLMSAVRLIRAAAPALAASHGSVVTIESISVKQPVAGLLLSNAMRPAVVGMIKTLADEFGPKGIRLNNILPGMILTGRARSLAEARAAATGQTVEEVYAATEAQIPLRRYGTPEEIAALAVFLASPLSSYLTGTSILCDGGLYRGLM